MRVICLSVEKGIVLGVNFTPVVHKSCWVGEADVTDPHKLALMARMPQFDLEHPGLVQVVSAPVSEAVVVTITAPEPEVVTIGALPDDMPGRGHLMRAEIESVEDIDAMSDEQLIAVDGIGPKKLKEIREHRKSKQ